MPSNDNFRTCICKHIIPLDKCWCILKHFEKMKHFDAFWAILNNFEQLLATLSNFEQLLGSFRAIWNILVVQVWVMLSHNMAWSTTDTVQKGRKWGCFEAKGTTTRGPWGHVNGAKIEGVREIEIFQFNGVLLARG